MSETPTEAAGRRPAPSARGLRRKLSALRGRLVRVEVIRRFAVALSVAIGGLAVFLLVDWFADLRIDMRFAALTGLAAVVAILLLRALAALVTQRKDDESLALMVEHGEPGFRSRLIAAVQFADGKGEVPDEAARSLVDRMVDDAERYAKPIAFEKIVNLARLRNALVLFFILAVLAAGAYFRGGSITEDLLRRAFLSDIPVPRATRVVWTTGDVKIGIGDSVRLEARVEGYRPDGGKLRLRFASGRKQALPLEPAGEEPGLYGTTVSKAQESFTYIAAINDGRSARREVRVLPRPAVVELAGRQTYPSYTGLDPTDHKPGEFLLFPGSRLDLVIRSSQPLRSGTVRLLGRSEPVVSRVDADDPGILRAKFVAPEKDLTGFTVELLDTEDMASSDPTVYRVDILRDEAPRIRIVRPSRQRDLVTPEARVLLAWEAEDRFGVERIVLRYEVRPESGAGASAAGGPDREQAPAVIRSIDLPMPAGGDRKVAESFNWVLGDLQPTLGMGDEIRFWLEAHDRNAESPPGKSATRLLKVVTEREKRDDLLSRAGDFLGRVDETTDDQERLNALLAEWIRSQAPLSPTGEPEAGPDPNVENPKPGGGDDQ